MGMGALPAAAVPSQEDGAGTQAARRAFPAGAPTLAGTATQFQDALTVAEGSPAATGMAGAELIGMRRVMAMLQVGAAITTEADPIMVVAVTVTGIALAADSTSVTTAIPAITATMILTTAILM